MFKLAHYFHKKRNPLNCRIIKIAVFVDNTLLNQSTKWKTLRDVLQIIKDASLRFENDFAISFTVINFYNWKLPTDISVFDSDLILNNLNIIAKRPTHHFDILLGITQRKLFSMTNNIRLDGAAVQSGRTAIIRLNENSTQCLVHEFGHIFGASHVKTYSIMNYDSMNAMSFDELNQKIIVANRNRRF